MTLSITVLVMEGTGALQLVVPMMLAVFMAKIVGDAVGMGVYDLHIKIRGAPVLVSLLPACCCIGVWQPACKPSCITCACSQPEMIALFDCMPVQQAVLLQQHHSWSVCTSGCIDVTCKAVGNAFIAVVTSAVIRFILVISHSGHYPCQLHVPCGLRLRYALRSQSKDAYQFRNKAASTHDLR